MQKRATKLYDSFYEFYMQEKISASNSKTRGPRQPCITDLITRQVSSQLAFRFKRRGSIQIFKMAAILDFQSE